MQRNNNIHTKHTIAWRQWHYFQINYADGRIINIFDMAIGYLAVPSRPTKSPAQRRRASDGFTDNFVIERLPRPDRQLDFCGADCADFTAAPTAEYDLASNGSNRLSR
jgi:hypothetical protein